MRRCRLCVLTLVVIVCAWARAAPTSAQTQNPPNQGEEVIKVNTNLVQTDVTVFDKQGGFVEGLKREQFVLKINGKPREISFFEQVRAGNRNEDAQIAAARGGAPAVGANNERPPTLPLDRGRTIFFFVDDLHMRPASMGSVRALLLRFIDRDLGQNDQAAIVDATGTVGFLQQLTSSKAVLRSAVDRLRARSGSIHDLEYPPMTEYQALQIDRGEFDSLDYFVDQYLKNNPMMSRNSAEQAVRTRATQILQQSGSLATQMLSSLEGLARSVSGLGGRKLIFLLTDGFLINDSSSDTRLRMRSVVAAAARSGSVIYSIDSRGLIASTTDGTASVAFDPSGRLSRADMGGIESSQDAMNALANDTGGRAFFNNNSLAAAVTTALKESSVYYLLAWRPEAEEQNNLKFRRIELSVSGRPELIVRSRYGFGEGPPQSSRAKTKQVPPDPKSWLEMLRAALGSAYPRTDLPVYLTLNFLNLPDRGPIVAASLKILTGGIKLEASQSMPSGNIGLAGILFDNQGKVVNGFDQRLTLKATSPNAKATLPDNVVYNHYFDVKPGLYQVRVAALEPRGRAGSALEWIEVPDLTSKALTLSTLIVGERKPELGNSQPEPDLNKPGGEPNLLSQTRLNVEHHFARASFLRFLTFVYNAAGSTAASPAVTPLRETGISGAPSHTIAASNSARGAPDLAVQVQIFRDDQPVLTEPAHKLATDDLTDLTRIPYAAELNLNQLQPGRYVLQVTVIDRISKSSAFQRFSFDIH